MSKLASMSATAFALGLIACLGLGTPAYGQTSSGGGAGAGTGAAPGGAGASHAADPIDLPIAKDPTVDEDEAWNSPPPPEEGEGPDLYGEDLPAESESIIYVLDISGSMDWGTSSYTGLDGNPTSGTKLQRAKTELIKSINALTEDWEFNIIAYDCSMRRWSGSRKKADAANKSAAASWVGGIRAGGATGTGAAGALALQEKDNFTVVILSDGAPNCLASPETFSGHLNMILQANTQGAKVHTFGIGAYGSFESFLRDVANRTGGRYYPVN